jgi:hypothetical protein
LNGTERWGFAVLYGTSKTPTSRNNRNYHTQKQNKAHTKTKWNNYPLKQKNIAKNYKQNETKRGNHAQKNYFYYLFIETMAKTQSNTWQEKEKRAKKTRKQKENGCLYSNDDRRARGLDALNRYLSKQMRGGK